MTTRTPGPWAVERPYGEGGVYVRAANRRATNPLICKMWENETDKGANAAFIVEACNAHDSLVAERDALRDALQELVAASGTARACLRGGIDGNRLAYLDRAFDAARAALAFGKDGGE